jgi:hypothetical protein
MLCGLEQPHARHGGLDKAVLQKQQKTKTTQSEALYA